MAFFTYGEKITSQGGTIGESREDSEATLEWWAIPLTSPAVSVGFLIVEARAAVIPTTYEGLWLQSIHATPDANGIYTVTAEYGPKKKRELAESTYRIGSGSETANVKYSLETISKHGPNGSDPGDGFGVLGWDGTTVQGAEIPVGGFLWTETHTLPQSTFSRSYAGMLGLRRGSVNAEAWKGFAAGEALFLGAEGDGTVQDADTGQYQWRVTYSFQGRPNETDINVGNNITIPAKDGWDRLEIRYRNVAADGLIKPKPYAAYVERVHPRVDFAEFGIGSDVNQ